MRRLLPGRTLRIALVVAATLAVTTAGLAYFTSHGSGSATAGVGTLAAPSITSATPGAGTVALSWTAVTPPASGTVTYYVLRDGTAPGGNCPNSGSPTTATSCTDSGLAAGTYHYTVTAVWRTWTATSATSTVTVNSGAATHFVLSAATATPTAGVDDALTITAKDAADITVALYTGSHDLTFGGANAIGTYQPSVTNSSGTAIAFGSTTAITFTNGVATASAGANGVMTLYKAESATITVTDGSISNTGLSVTVGAAAASQISLSGLTSDLASGSTRTLTATIKDVFENTVTSGADGGASVTFAATAGPGTVNGLGSSIASAGVATKVVTGALAGSVALQGSATLTGPGATNSNTLSFNIVAGAADHIDLSASTADLTSGLTRVLTATIKDAAGNTVSSDSSTSVTFAKTAGAGTVTGLGSATASSGATTKTVTGQTAGSITLAASASSPSIPAGATLTFSVVAGSATKLVITTGAQTITAAGAASGTITAQRQDTNSNATTLGGPITVNLTSTSSGGGFREGTDTSTVTSVAIASGSSSADFRYKDATAGSPTITAASSPLTSATQTVTVNAAGTKTAVLNNGAWNNPATWSPSGVPTASDNVFIGTGATNFTVVIPTGYSSVANSLTMGTNTDNTAAVLNFTDATSSLAVGGSIDLRGPNAGATSNLNVAAGTLTAGGDITFTNSSGTTNQSNRIVRMSISTGSVTAGGNVIFNSVTSTAGSEPGLAVIFSGAGTLKMNTIQFQGSGRATLTPSTGTVNFQSITSQTIPIGVSSVSYNNLNVNNTSTSGATLSAAVSATNVAGSLRVQSGILDNGGFAIVGGSGDTFQVAANATFKLSGTTSAFPTSYTTFTIDAASTVNYAGTGAQSVISTVSYGNLIASGGNTKTAAAALTINGDLTIGSSTTFSAGNFIGHTLKGDFTNNGTSFSTSSGSVVTFNGTSAQTISGSTATTFRGLTINNGTGVAVTGNDLTVSAALTLASGVVTISSNTLITSGATVTRGGGCGTTSCFVDGKLRKSFSAGAGQSALFEVGTGSTYSPINLSSLNVTANGTLTASSTVGQQPNYATSGLNPTQYVNRYWTLTPAGSLTASSYTAQFTFAAGDLVGSPDTSLLVTKVYNGTSWISPGTFSSTSTTATAAFGSGFGDYAVAMDPHPVITSPTSSSPKSVVHGSTTTFTIVGTDFESGCTVTISGGFTVNSVTFVDSSHLSVNVTAGGGGQKGTYDLTVTNPNGESGSSINSMINS